MNKAKKLLILYYTNYFKETLCDANGFAPHLAEDLCVVTTERECLQQADALLFHLPDIWTIRDFPPKATGQIWAAMTMESDANYPYQADPSVMRMFDIGLSYKSSADIRTLYFDPEHHLPVLRRAPIAKNTDSAAAYFCSSDASKNGRFEFVSELMQHLRVDSFGKSKNNQQLSADGGRLSKLDIIARYPFYLAFENSNCVDYVSEKVFDGLIAGSVPVYLGAPNIDELLPADKCIIKVSDFSSAEQLAKYLIELRHDETEYASYLEWKEQPLRDSFLDLIEAGREPSLRRLCRKISEKIENRSAKNDTKLGGNTWRYLFA